MPELADITIYIQALERRFGKRIASGFEGDLWLVLHPMLAGRRRWAKFRAVAPRSLP